MKEENMQTNKEISDQALDTVNTITNVSRSASLYGKLLAIKDMQIHLLKEEKLLQEQIEREESK
jgi:hypothetical protein|tara:strand:+ start:353 stop:544 length:192 start_codon:yes stop_codon:yes gene_type:complete